MSTTMCKLFLFYITFLYHFFLFLHLFYLYIASFLGFLYLLTS